jgi:hypothetical protein
MSRICSHLTTQERAVVMTMRDDECSIRSIAKRLGRETVGKLGTIIGQDLADPDRRGLLQAAQEIDTARFGHIAIDMHEDPVRGTVDRHDQIAARCFVRHLRPVRICGQYPPLDLCTIPKINERTVFDYSVKPEPFCPATPMQTKAQ